MGHEEPTSPSRLPPQENTDEHLFTVKVCAVWASLTLGWRTCRVSCVVVRQRVLCEHYVRYDLLKSDSSAKTDCFVGFIPQHALDQIVERRPIVLLTLAKRLLSLLSPQGRSAVILLTCTVLHIDAGLDWIQLDAGKVLVGEEALRVLPASLRKVIRRRTFTLSSVSSAESIANDKMAACALCRRSPAARVSTFFGSTDRGNLSASSTLSLLRHTPKLCKPFVKLNSFACPLLFSTRSVFVIQPRLCSLCA